MFLGLGRGKHDKLSCQCREEGEVNVSRTPDGGFLWEWFVRLFRCQENVCTRLDDLFLKMSAHILR